MLTLKLKLVLVLKLALVLALVSMYVFGAYVDAGPGLKRVAVENNAHYSRGGGTHVMHVGFSPTRQTLLAPSAKPREVLSESHEG